MSRLLLSEVSVQRGGMLVLDRVSLELQMGELLIVVGPNGAGKSTLIQAALGLVPLASGEVRVGARNLLELSHRQRAAELGWLPQRSTILEPWSVQDLVALSRYRFDESRSESRRQALEALERVRSTGLATRSVLTLSGGELQRVLLASLLAQDTPLLLADEPATHLDLAQQLDIYELLSEVGSSGRGVLLVSHDIATLGHIPDIDRARVVGLSGGQQKFVCGYDDDSLPSLLSELFRVRVERSEHGGKRLLLPVGRERP